MKIAIGADHGGYEIKGKLVNFLKRLGHRVLDYGTDTPEPCDYPQISYEVAKSVSAGKSDRGVLICKSGIGMVIVANKLPGVRAAAIYNEEMARSSRRHNDANIAVFGSNFNTFEEIKKLLILWLATKTEGGRHKRRVGQIGKIEKR